MSYKQIRMIYLGFALTALLLGIPLYWNLPTVIALVVHTVLISWYWIYSNYLGRLTIEAWWPVFFVGILIVIFYSVYQKVHDRTNPQPHSNAIQTSSQRS